MNKEYSWLLWFIPLLCLGGIIFLICFILFIFKEIPKEGYKCYSKMFLVSWCVFIIIFLSGNIFQIYLLKDIPFDITFFGIWIIIILLMFEYYMKLRNYLKKEHYEIRKCRR